MTQPKIPNYLILGQVIKWTWVGMMLFVCGAFFGCILPTFSGIVAVITEYSSFFGAFVEVFLMIGIAGLFLTFFGGLILGVIHGLLVLFFTPNPSIQSFDDYSETIYNLAIVVGFIPSGLLSFGLVAFALTNAFIIILIPIAFVIMMTLANCWAAKQYLWWYQQQTTGIV